eukprot:410846_1
MTTGSGFIVSSYILLIIDIMCILIVINWEITFYYVRQSEMVQKRYPKIVLSMGILCILFLVDRMMIILIVDFNLPYPYWKFIQYILTFSTLGALPWVIIWRAWMLFYHIKWNNALADQKWRLYIDPLETNIFLKYRHILGNKRVIFCVLAFIWMIPCFPACLDVYNANKFTQFARICMLFAGVIPMILMIILTCNIPQFDDIWAIHKEITLCIRVSVIGCVVYVVLSIILNAQPPSIAYNILIFVSIAINIGLSWVTFGWLFRTLNLPNNMYRAYIMRKTMLIANEMSIIKDDNIKDNKINQRSRAMFPYILEDENGLNLFARHLTHEFAVENLLFLIEIYQYLHSITVNTDNEETNMLSLQVSKFLTLKFPETAPKSMIVQNIHKRKRQQTIAVTVNLDIHELEYTNNMYQQAVQIFNKYVSQNGYFPINVSYETKKEITNFFKEWDEENGTNPEIMVLYHIFDKCIFEIYRLIQHSFYRFKHCDSYHQFIETLSAQQIE